MGKLEDLLVDEDKINESLLADTLAPYIGIGKSSNTIVLKPEFKNFKNKEKLLVFLLGRKALFKLKKIDEEEIGPKDISTCTGIKYGSVLPTLRNLDEEGLLVNENGKYMVANHCILNIKEMLE